jgi:hypothetical protein
VAFFGKLSYTIENSLLAYLIYILNLFVKFFPIILIIFSTISGYFIWRHYKHKHSKRKTVHSFFQIFEVLLVSIFSAFLILFIIGFIQLNIYSILVNKDPSTLGIKTDVQAIYDEIEKNNIAPNIIPSDKDYKSSIIAIAKTSSGTDNFYGEIILSNIPKLLILPAKKDVPNLLFLDNSIIITKVDLYEIQKLSPLIGKLFLEKYFATRNIKAYPKVNVLDEKKYQVFRKEDADEKIAKIISESQNMETSISSISANIEEAQAEIQINQNALISILEQRDKEYNSCLNEGTYDEDNNFIPDNSKVDCEPILEAWEIQYVNEENLGKELAKKLEEDQEKLKVYEYYDNFFKAQEELSDISVENIPSELGVFIPDDKLKVVLLTNNSKYISNYFATLVHEYLHYASYTPGKRLESSFFEEGLSEYFARQIIKNTMDKNVNIGYPTAYEIIDQITKRISEPDLAVIYFTKDQLRLEEVLNLTYGENFYNENIVYFESLMYIGDDDEALELANIIIKNIDGDPVTKDDIIVD